MIIHKVTRLNEIAPEMSEVYCTSGIGVEQTLFDKIKIFITMLHFSK